MLIPFPSFRFWSIVFLSLFFVPGELTGGGEESVSMLSETNFPSSPDEYTDSAGQPEATLKKPGDTSSRWVILTASLNLEHPDPARAVEKIIRLSDKFDRYVLHSDLQSITLNINKNEFQRGLDAIIPVGTILDKKISGRDVTERIYYLDNQLKSALNSKERFKSLIQQTQSISESIIVEKELERMDSTIGVHKMELKQTLHDNSYFRIEVSLHYPRAIRKPGPLGYVFLGIAKAGKWLFIREP